MIRFLLAAALVCVAAPASAQLSGEVLYTGTESGKINIEAFTEQSQSFEALELALVNPGPFAFDAVDDGVWTVVAYVDVDDDGQLGEEEPWVEAAAPVTVPPGSTSIVLDLDSYVAPSDVPIAEDDGCCAVLAGRRDPSALLALVFLGLIGWRRTF